MTEILEATRARSDPELIVAVRGGDLDAYGRLFARHTDAALRLARQLTRGSDAEDLVSEAFTKVMRILVDGGGPDVAFRAYLLTAVRRLYVDRVRREARLTNSGDMTAFDTGVPFQDTVVMEFESGAAARAFATLPERWQLVLWHLEVENQKPSDIAPLLGMSSNAVCALAHRAREGLRQAFLSAHLADTGDADCQRTIEHLSAYVRKGLARRNSMKVKAHLDGCRSCAAMYLELSEINSDLRGIIGPLLLGTAATSYLAGAGSGAGIAGPLVLLARARDAVFGASGTSAGTTTGATTGATTVASAGTSTGVVGGTAAGTTAGSSAGSIAAAAHTAAGTAAATTAGTAAATTAGTAAATTAAATTAAATGLAGVTTGGAVAGVTAGTTAAAMLGVGAAGGVTTGVGAAGLAMVAVSTAAITLGIGAVGHHGGRTLPATPTGAATSASPVPVPPANPATLPRQADALPPPAPAASIAPAPTPVALSESVTVNGETPGLTGGSVLPSTDTLPDETTPGSGAAVVATNVVPATVEPSPTPSPPAPADTPPSDSSTAPPDVSSSAPEPTPSSSPSLLQPPPDVVAEPDPPLQDPTDGPRP